MYMSVAPSGLPLGPLAVSGLWGPFCRRSCDWNSSIDSLRKEPVTGQPPAHVAGVPGPLDPDGPSSSSAPRGPLRSGRRDGRPHADPDLLPLPVDPDAVDPGVVPQVQVDGVHDVEGHDNLEEGVLGVEGDLQAWELENVARVRDVQARPNHEGDAGAQDGLDDALGAQLAVLRRRGGGKMGWNRMKWRG